MWQMSQPQPPPPLRTKIKLRKTVANTMMELLLLSCLPTVFLSAVDAVAHRLVSFNGRPSSPSSMPTSASKTIACVTRAATRVSCRSVASDIATATHNVPVAFLDYVLFFFLFLLFLVLVLVFVLVLVLVHFLALHVLVFIVVVLVLLLSLPARK